LRRTKDVPDSLKKQLTTDYGNADIGDDDKTILEFVETLTLRPHEITASSLDPLRQAGFDDKVIHEIVQVTAYFAYVNRIADGLGVELES